MRELSPQQLVFIKEFSSGKCAADAARVAGYGPEYAKRAADKLLKNPKIKAAIDQEKAKLREDTGYDMEAAAREIDALIDEARQAKQYTAASSLLQHKLKLHGLLEDRVRHLDSAPSLTLAIQAARARTFDMPLAQQPRQLEHVAVEPLPEHAHITDIFKD